MVVQIEFQYKAVSVKATVHLGTTPAGGDDPDVIIKLQTNIPGGPFPYLESILEEGSIEYARKVAG